MTQSKLRNSSVSVSALQALLWDASGGHPWRYFYELENAVCEQESVWVVWDVCWVVADEGTVVPSSPLEGAGEEEWWGEDQAGSCSHPRDRPRF